MLGLGKLVSRQMDPPVQPVGSVPNPVQEEMCCSSLLFLGDVLSDREFLVDSGASVSVFPWPKSTSDDGVRLLTADGSLLICSGSWIIPLRYSCGSGSKCTLGIFS